MSERTSATPYEKLLAGTISEAEKAARKRASTRLSVEARRRATTVLVDLHKEEYDAIYKAERAALTEDPHYRLPWITEKQAS